MKINLKHKQSKVTGEPIPWEETKPVILEVPTESSALFFAKTLANYLNAEVRVSLNEQGAGALYYRPKIKV